MQSTQLRFSLSSGVAGQRLLSGRALQPCAVATFKSAPRRLVVEARELSRKEKTEQRHRRIRSKISGTPERPRLAIYRSNQHIYAQVIDDEAGFTLAAASTLSPEIREALGEAGSNNEEAAKLVGSKIAELCKQKNIDKVCFDRGGFRYHGRVQALADAAREGGLHF